MLMLFVDNPYKRKDEKRVPVYGIHRICAEGLK